MNTDPNDPLNPTGNTVEFIGYQIKKDGDKSSVNCTNSYRLVGMYVYDGVYN